MAKTNWIDGNKSLGIVGTQILAAFMNKIFTHRHDGADFDGSAPINYAVDTGAANAYVIALTPPLTAHVTGMPILFRAVNANTGGTVTININGLGAVVIHRADGNPPQGGDISAGQIVPIVYDGTYYQLAMPLAANAVVQRGSFAGLTMSTAGSSTTMSIAAGQAADSTNSVLIALASAFNKTTASWSLGSGGGALDTGTSGGQASTWYYWFLIRRPDTGVVDLICSLASNVPTLPANYTQYRYIGAGYLDASKNWTAFTQMGREFYWSTPVLDFSGAGSTTAALLTCSVPHGRKVKVFQNIAFNVTGSNDIVYISDPNVADIAPSNTAAPLGAVMQSSGGGTGSGQSTCWTNTSAQVRHREYNTNVIYIATLGWIDLADTNL